LTPQQYEQHTTWLKRAMSTNGGPLYDDGTLQIATKIEVKLSQARITLYYRNNGTSAINDLDLKIEDPAGLLRFELSSVAPTLEPNGQGTGILMVECMKPASPGPTIKISYKDTRLGKRSNQLNLPVTAATFNDPLQMNSADFNAKWNQLTAAGQHKQEVFRPSQAISTDAVRTGLTGALKFGNVSGMPDESLYVIYGASSLKTGAPGPNNEKVSVGCLVKIEMNVQSNAIRLTARTLHPAATIAVFECARQLLG
jgi:AP-2 complex subunit alpha